MNIQQLPEPEKKMEELRHIIADIPPDSILANQISKAVWDLFLVNKRINIHTAQRLNVRSQGDAVESTIPEDIKGLVVSLAAYYSAQYDLIFECWDELKPSAIKANLLSRNSKPRDALKIILDAGFVTAFKEKVVDIRSIDKQAHAIYDRLTRDIKTNQKSLVGTNMSPRERSKISADWDIELEALDPLLQLLLNISTKNSRKPGVIASATIRLSMALLDYQREQSVYHRRLYK